MKNNLIYIAENGFPFLLPNRLDAGLPVQATLLRNEKFLVDYWYTRLLTGTDITIFQNSFLSIFRLYSVLSYSVLILLT